jgi:hypothetical protein
MEGGAYRAHDAMGGPQGLGTIRQADRLERDTVFVLAGEGDVIGRVPVLRQDDCGKSFGKLVDQGDYGVAIGDRQGATWAEIVLDVYDQKRCVLVHANEYKRIARGN